MAFVARITSSAVRRCSTRQSVLLSPSFTACRRPYSLPTQSSSSPPPPSSDDKSSKGSSTADGQVYRARSTLGVFNFKALAIFLGTGAGLFLYFQNEKSKIEERKREEMAPKRMGRPNLGGPFELVDTKGNQYTDKDMLGKWSLVYFGFTNCPDICPEELDKMGHIVDYTREKQGTVITPLFITCDPARDSPQAIDAYLRDFHSSIIGLTGSYDNIKTACKGYRVYFSSPPTAKPGDDYLVDHSIFFYLMDPEGKFVEAFGRSEGRERTRERVGKFIKEWEAGERWETS